MWPITCRQQVTKKETSFVFCLFVNRCTSFSVSFFFHAPKINISSYRNILERCDGQIDNHHGALYMGIYSYNFLQPSG